MRKIARFALLVALAPTLLLLTPVSQAQATSLTTTFASTGVAQSWTVPNGITSIQFRVIGASGGTTFSNRGGYGESITGTLSVTPGETLRINVGRQGSPHSSGNNAAAFNGGGSGYYYGAGGGGASDIRRGGSALANRVVVAGGGGGAGQSVGANSGFLIGDTGADAGLSGSGMNADGGGGGTQSAGGAGGAASSMCGGAGSNGSLGLGGNGNASSAGGGGGGGGYYGGGGGGAGCNATSGGGGSSYVHPTQVTNYSYSLNEVISNGSIVISYAVTTPASVSVALTGGGNQVIYRTTATLRVSVSSAGKVTFYADGKKIPGCISKNVSSNFDCGWKPSKRGSVAIQVKYTNTSGTEIDNDSPRSFFLVSNRTSKR